MKRVLIIISGIILAVINIAAFYYGIWRIDYDILMPGGINEIEDKVIIMNDNEQKGTFNSVYVYSVERPTRLMVWLAEPMIGVEAFELSETTSLLSNAQLSARGKLLYDTGLEYSLIHAYEAADANINYFLEFVSISYYDPSLNDLDIGLEITGVNGVDISSYASFVEIVTSSNSVTLNTTDGDYFMEKTSGIYGVQILPNYKVYEADPPYAIQTVNVAGSSGGLLQTLSIFNQLTETDYTHGLKIGGTGTISTSGYVGPIGGVSQKVIAAARDGLDIFFVPAENYLDAVETNELMNLELNIVKVETFEDAVTYLVEEGASIE